jgi:hypothetical protein
MALPVLVGDAFARRLLCKERLTTLPDSSAAQVCAGIATNIRNERQSS